MILRLQKFMAENGIASRRKSEELIAAGIVKVNGIIITEPGYKINSEKDIVEVSGVIIKPTDTELFYYILNKPKGYVSTAKDQFGRPSVVSLIKNDNARLYPVGRLDYDTEGLIIITNDGELTNQLTHPSYSVTKEYEATVRGIISHETAKAFEAGIDIEGYITKPAKIQIISKHRDSSTIRITISEGKNRQVRKMCAAIGHEVINLKRISIGALSLESLEIGHYLATTKEEILNKTRKL